MNALVTGATGFLGTWLVGELCRQGYKVIRLIRDRTFIEAGSFNRIFGTVDIYGDIMDLALLERAIAEYEVDTVFHLAAQAAITTAIADPLGTFKANVEGTWNVLEAARRQKARRVIVASSDKAYGPSDILPYHESMALIGKTPYEVSKSCADLIAQSYASTYGMSIGVTRCSNLYGGGHLNWSTLIPGTIKRLWDGIPPVVNGGGQMIREFLYVEDAVNAYITLAKSDRVGSFNFGGGEPKKIIDVVMEIKRLMYSRVEPEIKQGNRNEIKDQWLDCTRAKTELGWKPSWNFEDGLRESIKWYENFFIQKGTRLCV